MNGILTHLLVAIDESETRTQVVSYAIALARRQGSDVLFCHSVDRTGLMAEFSTSSNEAFNRALPEVQALDDTAEAILSEAAKRATDVGLVVATIVLEGSPARAISECAKERMVDAIVMGTRGKRGLERVFMGSIASGVLSHTDLPTFVVPPVASERHPAFGRILVAIDDSDPSAAAAAFALRFAEAEEARLVFCAVVKTAEFLEKGATSRYDTMSTLEALLARQTDWARKNDVASESVIAEGDPAEKILEMAVTRHSDLLVVGSHGRRGLHQLFVGSVAKSIICCSQVPVVVVKAASPHAGHQTQTAQEMTAYG